MQTELKIDPQFKSLIPPLSEEEFRQLEQNILSYGKCRDALVSWRNILIDGHNRLAICQKHSIAYDVAQAALPSRKAVELWIIENQLGRRNISDAAKIELAARKVKLEPHKKGVTRQKIADAAGVSEQTVYKFMKIKQLGSPKLLAQVTNGEEKIGTAYGKLKVTTTEVKQLCTPEEIKEFNRQQLPIVVRNVINGLKNLYDFISENTPIAGSDDVLVQIREKLDEHREQLLQTQSH